MLSQGQKGSALRLLIRWQPLPLGTAHRTKQDRVALFAKRQRLGGQRIPRLIDGCATHEGFAQIETKLFKFRALLKNGDRLSHDFGSDTVTGQNSNFKCKGTIHFSGSKERPRILKKGSKDSKEMRSASPSVRFKLFLQRR